MIKTLPIETGLLFYYFKERKRCYLKRKEKMLSKQKAYIVGGLGFGDEGKGATVDYLTRKKSISMIVRYNGGPQTAHNVVLKDGRHHTFSQFGSGMFIPDVATYLSRWMLINPENMLNEAKVLEHKGVSSPLSRVFVDEDALIITPYHVAVNRILASRNNTCGQGIKQVREDQIMYKKKVLRADDLFHDSLMERRLDFTKDLAIQKIMQETSIRPRIELGALFKTETIRHCIDVYKEWREKIHLVCKKELPSLFAKHKDFLFEGAQGVLLDETHGEQNYNTWTDCTFNNAYDVLNQAEFKGKSTKIGVLRTYYTRHGDGPFPTEDKSLSYLEPHNNGGSYQGKFRFGNFDPVLARKAIDIVSGIDELAINHIDQCPKPQNLAEIVEVKSIIEGYGPTAESRKCV